MHELLRLMFLKKILTFDIHFMFLFFEIKINPALKINYSETKLI